MFVVKPNKSEWRKFFCFFPWVYSRRTPLILILRLIRFSETEAFRKSCRYVVFEASFWENLSILEAEVYFTIYFLSEVSLLFEILFPFLIRKTYKNYYTFSYLERYYTQKALFFFSWQRKPSAENPFNSKKAHRPHIVI